MRFLLDTDSVSYFLRGQGHVASSMLARPPADLGIPAPVLYESRCRMRRLPEGRRREALLAALDELLRAIEVVPFDAGAAECAASARAALAGRGTVVGPVDMQIAGIALATGCVLVTRNSSEFGRIGGLQLQDWYDNLTIFL